MNNTSYTNEELENMINSKDWENREIAAQRGYGLEILIGDEHWRVRAAVAQRGYGLETLIGDSNGWVRDSVIYYLGHEELTKERWDIVMGRVKPQTIPKTVENDVEFDDEKMYIYAHSDNWFKRRIAAEHGFEINTLINDCDEEVRNAAHYYLERNNLTLDEWLNKATSEDKYEQRTDTIKSVRWDGMNLRALSNVFGDDFVSGLTFRAVKIRLKYVLIIHKLKTYKDFRDVYPGMYIVEENSAIRVYDTHEYLKKYTSDEAM